MTNSQQHHSNPPTPGQLKYLRQLASSRGQSFAYPQTFGEADTEIKRLKGQRRTSYQERRQETRQVQRDMAERRSASVRKAELSGYGSTATWNRHVEDGEEELEREKRFLAAR